MLNLIEIFRQINEKYLVVGPLSTVQNWENEFRRFCPTIKTKTLFGDKPARKEVIKQLKNGEWDVLLTSYEMCTIEKFKLNKFKYQYIVVDEAHRIKNEKARLSESLRTFKSKGRLLLTGTPLQNTLHELWPLLNYLSPDMFDSAKDFDSWFDTNDLLKDSDVRVEQLRTILKSFMLRRLKSDVELSIPPKNEVKLFVGLTSLQREVYKKVLFKEVSILSNVGEPKFKHIISILMELRKASQHPYLIDNIEPEPHIDGEHLVDSCGKMILLDKLLAKLKSQGSRVLLFSQFKIVLNIVEDYLNLRKYEYRRLDGETGYVTRAKEIDEFNQNENIFIYLLTTRAGGLGTYKIHF